jgi:hypothetical protein
MDAMTHGDRVNAVAGKRADALASKGTKLALPPSRGEC